MDLFLVCICLVISAVALDRAISVPCELPQRQRVWIQAIWITIAILWLAMAIKVQVLMWPGI